MHSDPDQGHQDNENQHERRTEFDGVNKSKIATPQTTIANPKPTSPIGKVHKDERGNCRNDNGSKHNSEEK